jgi:Zn-dependent oligopeptidase
MTEAEKYLYFLNKKYHKLHKTYEELFWQSYMGDHRVDKRKDIALAKRDSFRANSAYLAQVNKLIRNSERETRRRLGLWVRFFEMYQTPRTTLETKKKIDELESKINRARSNRKEGYIDPKTKKFVSASSVQMSVIIGTNPDENVRKACFVAKEKLATGQLEEYLQLIKLRNRYAKQLGYSDFYDFKVRREDGMTKQELFKIFDSIYKKTKYAKKNILKLEKKNPGLRKPWNFGYIMSGNFTKEEDQYFQFDEALMRWGKSFTALGIDFRGGSLKLDLLDRKGKWNNGFCHWPELVRYENNKRIPGTSNFTCNVVFGQVGSGDDGYNTLFHEGGHAAHLLNSDEQDVCVNHEYAPMSMSWAETQSMFMDTLFGSYEWLMRYARNKRNKSYPLSLYKKILKKHHLLRPLGLNSIIFVSNFEREIYEHKNLSIETIKTIAKRNFRKYFERSEDSFAALGTPHIYSWESSASYHGYGLALLAVHQWREYFYNKYGYIVDNPNVGHEMTKVWKLGSTKTFYEFVMLATGKKLSADTYIKNVTASLGTTMKRLQKRIKVMNKIKSVSGKVKLNVQVHMTHGKREVSNSTKSFENMAIKYKKWLQTQKIITK